MKPTLQMKVSHLTSTMNTKQLNTAGQITITVENHDQFVHLHNSYLIIDGEVAKADNTRYADGDLVGLTNNGLMYLFSSFKLTPAGQEVEHVNSPGHASSLLGLANYSGDFNKGCGLSQGWFPDSDIIQMLQTVGFQFVEPTRYRNLTQKAVFNLLFHLDIFLGLWTTTQR